MDDEGDKAFFEEQLKQAYELYGPWFAKASLHAQWNINNVEGAAQAVQPGFDMQQLTAIFNADNDNLFLPPENAAEEIAIELVRGGMLALQVARQALSARDFTSSENLKNLAIMICLLIDDQKLKYRADIPQVIEKIDAFKFNLAG